MVTKIHALKVSLSTKPTALVCCLLVLIIPCTFEHSSALQICYDDYICPELDEDECALQSPCSHSCNNIMGGFSCSCPSGFTISTESNVCQGRTERRLQQACVQLSHVQIKCNLSFFLYHVDTDECLQGLHMCHYNQQCVNTVGAYRCQAKCGAGFKPSVTGTGCEGKLPEMILR